MKRYEPDNPPDSAPSMKEDATGDWVRYDDHAAAIAALEAEVAQWRVRVERIQAELIARGADSAGDEASAYNDAALALRVLLDSAALADQPVTGSPR